MADTDLTVAVCIITGFGINTDREMAQAFALAGGRPERVHVNDLIADPARLDSFRIFVISGGFSFGDHIGSGAMLAALMTRTLRAPLAAFIDRGGLVLGVCNGFQVLVRMGLVPGISGWSQSVALVHNDSGRFEDRWVRVAFDRAAPCVWTRGITTLALPVRHGEGKLVAAAADLDAIDAGHLGVARYTAATPAASAAGTSVSFPANPNGSLRDLAGLCDPSGRVLGMMPHPEAFLHRYHHPTWRNTPVTPADGALQLFRNAVHYAHG